MRKETVGQRIRRLRTGRRMTQEVLAERLHVSFSTVSSWERSRTKPDLVTIVELSELFGVSLPYLITGTEQND